MPGLYQPNALLVRQAQTFRLVLEIGFVVFCSNKPEALTMHIATKLSISLTLACVLLLATDTAHALRCGNRLVKDGMHESEVKAICGEPVSERALGYVIRSFFHPGYGYAGYNREVLVTEFVYNFGPRKLMRKLRFEGGILTSIETIGYGYRE